MNWKKTPPDSEGFWWLYGEWSFGTMGGHFTGSIPPEFRLHPVEIITIGHGKKLIGICQGQFVILRPFDKEKQEEGYVGVWKKMDVPNLPDTKELSPSDMGKMWK